MTRYNLLVTSIRVRSALFASVAFAFVLAGVACKGGAASSGTSSGGGPSPLDDAAATGSGDATSSGAVATPRVIFDGRL